MEATMGRFVHPRPIERYRALLAEVTDDAKRQQIQKLLAEERSKKHALARTALVRLLRINTARLPELLEREE
jgi:hypothetical protein